ncbi:MAG: hypothetical protein IKI35_05635 [Stomatobaculum sp.]|nr:hypothetical protein [Stomatobaculum sp.]
MYDELIRGLIREMESYAAIAESEKPYCAQLMNRAAKALRKERDHAAVAAAAWSGKEN